MDERSRDAVSGAMVRARQAGTRLNDGQRNVIVQGDNLDVVAELPNECARLIYLDPPFNTGSKRRSRPQRAIPSAHGLVGFAGRRYARVEGKGASYQDEFEDFEAFMVPRLAEARRLLAPDGSLFVHIDPRESHYVKVWLDDLFGRESFVNEIIWAYDFGGRSRKRWPAKHDTILWYAKDPRRYVFNRDAMDRIPYMAPGLQTAERAAKGKTPTDTWWHTIVPTSGSEKTGYPTQKPLGVLRRIVAVHSEPGDLVLDFFAGSGTTGEAAARLDRRFFLVDDNPEAIEVARQRLKFARPRIVTMAKKKKTKVSARKRGASKGTGSGSAAGSAPQALDNVGRMSVIAVTVSAYDHLKPLAGAKQDARQIKRLFSSNKDVALFDGSSTFLEDPTASEVRDAITSYVADRGARGDILLFYFSGHGSIVGGPGNEFGFCTKDTRKRPDGDVLPLSVISFRDVIRTLAMADVHPVFIIDACFASAIGGSMHDDLQRHMGGSYAFLCSSYESTESLDFKDGGAFTKALVEACLEGRTDSKGKRLQCLTLSDVAPAIRERLEQAGHPLSRCHLGPDLPAVPIARNVAFKPKRYKLSGYFVELVQWLYNDGDPRPIKKKDIATIIGNGAYGNHNKLSYRPWGLLKDGSASQTRELTPKGIRFAEGRATVPEEIEQDPISGDWHAVPGSPRVRVS